MTSKTFQFFLVCTDTSVAKKFEDPHSFYAKLLTDKQTKRQTNAGHYITSLAEVTIGLYTCLSHINVRGNDDRMTTIRTVRMDTYIQRLLTDVKKYHCADKM